VLAHVLGSVLVWVAVLRLHLGLTEPITADEPATPPIPTPVAPHAS
jgi:hypothetical protein